MQRTLSDDLRARDDRRCAEVFEIRLQLDASRRRRDFVSAPREQMHGERSHPAARPGDDHVAIRRPDVVLLEREEAEHRRESGGADAHRVLERDVIGNLHDRVGADALALRVTAPISLAESLAVPDHAIARLEFVRRRLDDGPGEVDADDHREAANDLPAPSDGEPVFVIERGVGDVDEDIVRRKLGDVLECDFVLRARDESSHVGPHFERSVTAPASSSVADRA